MAASRVNRGRAGQVLPGVAGSVGSWLAISLCAFVIWLVSEASGGQWFLWAALPLGARRHGSGTWWVVVGR